MDTSRIDKESSFEMKSIQKIISDLPPCCLVRIGHRIVVGTYKLDEPTGKRHGSLDLYTIGLEKLQSVRTSSAILDMRYSGEVIYTAHSTGEVRLWNLVGDELVQRSQVQIDHNSLVLQIAVQQQHSLLAASLSSGEVLLFDLSKQQEVWRNPSHTLEAWACHFDVDLSGIYSGGDDAFLCYHDMRSGSVEWRLRHHDAGLTSLLPWQDSQQTLWTGGYDDHLRIVDTRARRSRESLSLGGGVWRLEQDSLSESSSANVLACCMYGGAKVLSVGTDYGIVPTIVGELTNHESMVYGGAWIGSSNGVTCSFYDGLIQSWTLDS